MLFVDVQGFCLPRLKTIGKCSCVFLHLRWPAVMEEQCQAGVTCRFLRFIIYFDSSRWEKELNKSFHSKNPVFFFLYIVVCFSICHNNNQEELVNRNSDCAVPSHTAEVFPCPGWQWCLVSDWKLSSRC